MTDGPIDEVAVAGALRRLDAVIAAHPELLGPSGPDNVSDWIDTIETDERGHAPMAKEKDPTTQVAFRLPEHLIARLDRHAERMSKEHPGLEFSRADAVRTLLTRALDEVEPSDKRRGGKGSIAMGIFTRGSKLWIAFKGADGKWRNVASGFAAGQEDLARARFETLQAAAKAQKPIGVAARPTTVRTFAAEWLEQRRATDHEWKHDRGKLNIHVLPVIGDMVLADVRARHVIDLFTKIRANRERPVAPRYLYNIYAVTAALFRDAKRADKIAQTPCELDERDLGPLVDKDPEWRAGAVFARDEVELIITSPLIPLDRQMVYALEFLAGLRHGEAAALRWRHYDPTLEPLGQLLVAHSFNTQKHAEKSTKTGAVRYVPVHPTLAAMLAEWKLGGWAAMVGRAPEPDDLVVPLPPDVAARRYRRKGEPFRGYDYDGLRWREDDLPALGLRHRRGHDMRATFITLALEDGADPHVIETRVTHARSSGSRSAFTSYNRGRQWDATCREVAKLRINRGHREAISMVAGDRSAPAPYDPLTAAPTGQTNSSILCERGDSNPHDVTHWHLRPARLPIPPRSRVERIGAITLRSIQGVRRCAMDPARGTCRDGWPGGRRRSGRSRRTAWGCGTRGGCPRPCSRRAACPGCRRVARTGARGRSRTRETCGRRRDTSSPRGRDRRAAR